MAVAGACWPAGPRWACWWHSCSTPSGRSSRCCASLSSTTRSRSRWRGRARAADAAGRAEHPRAGRAGQRCHGARRDRAARCRLLLRARRAGAARHLAQDPSRAERSPSSARPAPAKSSLVGLLARFYDPQEGAVLLDGMDIRTLRSRICAGRSRSCRKIQSASPDTIRSNIRLYDTIDQRRAGCAMPPGWPMQRSFIEQLPDGYDYHRAAGWREYLGRPAPATLAGPRDRAEPKRRAGARRSDVSSIDTATEALIQDALERMLRSRTSVVIAHRLTTIRKADRIIVMDRGRIIEDGPHEELLRLGGHYARLYRHQMQTPAEHGDVVMYARSSTPPRSAQEKPLGRGGVFHLFLGSAPGRELGADAGTECGERIVLDEVVSPQPVALGVDQAGLA